MTAIIYNCVDPCTAYESVSRPSILDFAGIIPVIAVAIFIMAGLMVFRGMRGIGRQHKTINELFQAAITKQLNETESNDAPARVVCQFCGSSEKVSQSSCGKCGAPLG